MREPSILILDEATSHVDNETEVRIQRHLKRATVDITMFVVVHRLLTVRDADRILVMDDGKFVEEASHDELIKRDGLYANLWRVQEGQVESLSPEFLDRVTSEQI